jgi:SpoVK/Ycf46/Vps4 family AAA+-type ATPase
MDERWFLDLPNEEERIEILKIHLARVRQDPSTYNLLHLSEQAKDMVGREIEQCIDAALIRSFNARSEVLDEDILATGLRRKPRIVKTMTDEVKELTDWVGYDPEADDGIKARWASPPSRVGGKFRSGAFQIIEGGGRT